MAFISEGGIQVYSTRAELPAISGDIGFAYTLDTKVIYRWDPVTSAWNELTPQTWVNGVKKTYVKEYLASVTVSGGTATFYLTDDGTSGGNAIFTNVYTESMNMFVQDVTNSYMFGNISVAGNKKSLTVTVNKLGTVLIGVIQLISAANGTVVYLQLKGD